ncbi:MAG: L-threonylcarbamoyladenylate synthase [Microbacteriaceae bacterium]|nr:L-threonylcarbamoyladenylate synthase [Microbacteriaceae bacterium]
MVKIYDCLDTSEALTGLRLARQAVGRGDLIVIPTDTVYGVAADAFNPAAVQKLLDAKGRGRTSPPPVLVSGIETLDALAEQVTSEMRALAEAFWPGGLTIVVPSRTTLAWDLGDTNGTAALRMPDHALTLELLRESGPLAVSSANLTGQPAALTATEAHDALGDRIAVYLETGESSGSRVGSTIVDSTPTVTGKPVRVLRDGTVSRDSIRAIVGAIEGDE